MTSSITIPDGLTSIETNAFMFFSTITTFNLPSSVTSIGNGAFQNCNSLKSITLPSSIITIDEGAFWYCTGLTSIIIPSSVNSIGVSAFKGCSSLTGSLIIPTSVKSIGISAFQECAGLTGSLVIPSSVTSVGNHAFSKCSGLTSVSISSSLTTIENYTFESCTGLSGSLVIPSSVNTIANAAFWECSGLTSVTIPTSVTTIGDAVFSSCSKLNSVTIPSSVTSIGSFAFSDCISLLSIYTYKSTPIDLSTSTFVFSNVNKTTCKLYVPFAAKTTYQAANQWKDFVSIVEMASTCTLPTTKATSFTSSAFTNNSMTIGWTRGNGNSVLVVAKSGSAVNGNPADGTSYTASSIFGNGTQIGTGNYVVYNGTGTSLNLSSLTKGTAYHYAIYEYNTAANCYMTTALLGNATTTSITSTTIDFETLGQNWNWVIFENWDNAPALYSVVANPNVSGINTSVHTAKYIVNASGQPWAGLWSTDCGDIVITKDNCMIKIMVYKDQKTNFDLKLENGTYNYEKLVPNTKVNQWEELTFDFSSQIGQTFKTLTIIPDFPSVRTIGSINYWDNISFNPMTILPSSTTYSVTVPVGTKACYIAGEMNNWTQQAMTKVNETHYSIALTSLSSYGYKYCSGPGWPYEELDANSNVIANRVYSANDVVLKWKAVYSPTGLNSQHDNEKITIFPNPIINDFKVKGFEGAATLKVFDINGSQLLSKNITNNSSISFGTLPKGLYVLKLIMDEGIVERKIVKK